MGANIFLTHINALVRVCNIGFRCTLCTDMWMLILKEKGFIQHLITENMINIFKLPL